ncbi:MAG: ROK family protein [Clostridia bacterium]
MVSIGIDIGGTNIAGGIVSEDLRLLCKRSIPFPGAQNPNASIPAIAGLVQSLLEEKEIPLSAVDSIGIAVPGSIDYTACSVIDAHNLGYHDFQLIQMLRMLLPEMTMYVENDANAAALAEFYCGAFRGYTSGLLITIGTGIGGGLVLDGKLFVGGKKNGFEFGHAILQFGGESCTCGNLGCIESYCSATALIRAGRRAASMHPHCMIVQKCGGDGKKIDAKLVIDCAKAGDSIAMELFNDYVAHLGAAISTAIALFDPEVIALGGGVAAAGEFLLQPVRDYVAPRAFFRNFGKIVSAEMGNDAGILGAAMMHRQHKTK